MAATIPTSPPTIIGRWKLSRLRWGHPEHESSSLHGHHRELAIWAVQSDTSGTNLGSIAKGCELECCNLLGCDWHRGGRQREHLSRFVHWLCPKRVWSWKPWERPCPNAKPNPKHRELLAIVLQRGRSESWSSQFSPPRSGRILQFRRNETRGHDTMSISIQASMIPTTQSTQHCQALIGESMNPLCPRRYHWENGCKARWTPIIWTFIATALSFPPVSQMLPAHRPLFVKTHCRTAIKRVASFAACMKRGLKFLNTLNSWHPMYIEVKINSCQLFLHHYCTHLNSSATWFSPSFHDMDPALHIVAVNQVLVSTLVCCDFDPHCCMKPGPHNVAAKHILVSSLVGCRSGPHCC